MLLIYSYPKGTEPSLLSLAFGVVVLYMLPLSFCPFQGCFIGAVGFLLVLDSINLAALGRVGFLVLGFFSAPLREILKCPHGWIGGSSDFRCLHKSVSVLQNPPGLGAELQLASRLVYGGPSRASNVLQPHPVLGSNLVVVGKPVVGR